MAVLSLKAYNYARDIGFQRRVKFFMSKAAIAVLGEATPIGDEHTKRIAFASSILDGSARESEYAIGVVTNPTISASIENDVTPNDTDLAFTVNSMFSDFSGFDA